jgi:hypothetical protein
MPGTRRRMPHERILDRHRIANLTLVGCLSEGMAYDVAHSLVEYLAWSSM